jgi:hypothetical protein
MNIDEMGNTCSMHREMRNEYRILIRKTEGREIGRDGRIILNSS